MQLEGTVDFVVFSWYFSCILIEFDSWLSYKIFWYNLAEHLINAFLSGVVYVKN